MADEIRTEEIVETEVVETEDVNENEGLSATEYAVIGGIMAAGVLVFEGGKWVWKKTAGPRGKVAGFCKEHNPFGKKAKKEAEESQDQDHEGSAKKSSKKTKEKKTETKEKSEEK